MSDEMVEMLDRYYGRSARTDVDGEALVAKLREKARSELKAEGWRIVKLDGPRNPAIRNEPLYAVENEL